MSLQIDRVEVSASAAAQLAYLLHEHGEQTLALHLGHAIDHLHEAVLLTSRERAAVLKALTVCPSELADLRAALLANRLSERRATRS